MLESQWPPLGHVRLGLVYAGVIIVSTTVFIWWIPYASVYSPESDKVFLSYILSLMIWLAVVLVLLATTLQVLDQCIQPKPLTERWSWTCIKKRVMPQIQLGLIILIALWAMSLALEMLTYLAIPNGYSRVAAEYAYKTLSLIAVAFFGFQIMRAAANL